MNNFKSLSVFKVVTDLRTGMYVQGTLYEYTAAMASLDSSSLSWT